MKSTYSEVFRFIIVGIIAVTTDLVVYLVLLNLVHLSTHLSKSISFVTGASLSFLGHKNFVFKPKNGTVETQVVLFVCLYISALFINTTINEILLSSTFSVIVSWFVATCTSTIWNYLGMKFVVFRMKNNNKPIELDNQTHDL